MGCDRLVKGDVDGLWRRKSRDTLRFC